MDGGEESMARRLAGSQEVMSRFVFLYLFLGTSS